VALRPNMSEIPFESIEGLFKLHYHRFYGLAYNLVRDKDAAKDIVQDVFYKVWKNQDNIDLNNRTVGYFLTATSRTALTYLRTRKRIVNFETQSDFMDNLKSSPGFEEIGYTELEEKVQRAIERLPPKCKAIFILSREEGMKYAEIAKALGLSLKTVENQMGIALQRLRDELKPYITPEMVILFLALLTELIIYFF
jgi:RNA polymerase sigma-70 factor (ECF subfamily)